jgi:hypothetical protein
MREDAYPRQERGNVILDVTCDMEWAENGLMPRRDLRGFRDRGNRSDTKTCAVPAVRICLEQLWPE